MVSEAFVKIYFFFLLFNVSAFMIQAMIEQAQTEGMQNTDAQLAFSIQHLNQSGTLFINSTNIQGDNSTLVGQFYNPLNQTGYSGFPVDIVNQQSEFNVLSIDNAVRFVDGGFILDGFDNFGLSIGLDFPDAIKIGIAVIIGFLTFAWLLYVLFGRST